MSADGIWGGRDTAEATPADQWERRRLSAAGPRHLRAGGRGLSLGPGLSSGPAGAGARLGGTTHLAEHKYSQNEALARKLPFVSCKEALWPFMKKSL